MTETDESVKHRESSDAALWGTGGITGGTRTSRNPDETCDPDKERHIFTIGLERRSVIQIIMKIHTRNRVLPTDTSEC